MPTATATLHITRDRSEAALTLAVAAAGTLLVLAVFSAVVTTVSASMRALHGGTSGETWVLSGMSLGLAASLLTAGTLADDLGRRRMLVLSSGSLALASVLGALALSPTMLVAARILQGAAGAGLLTAALGAIGHTFPDGHGRTRAATVWGSALGAGIAIGPLAGAALATSLGWRSSYWLMALAAAMLAPAAATIEESRSATKRRIDLPGALTLALAMTSVTAGLVEARGSWSATATIALLAAGALLLALFAAIELRRREPMFELGHLAHPLFVASLSGALFTGLGTIGLMSFTPLLLHDGLGVGAIASAGVLAVWSGTSTAVALAARPLLSRLTSASLLALGFVICAAGEVALAGIAAGASWTRLLPGLGVTGIGSGLVNSSLGRLAVESVPRERAGMGSGANNTARYLGGAAGVALVVALATSDGAGATGLLHGWTAATLVCAALCLAGALVAAACRARR